MNTAKLDTSKWVKVRARGGTHYFEDCSGVIVAKECRDCKEAVLLEDYRNDKRGLAGKVAKCTPCNNARGRAYKRANPEKIKQQGIEYRKKYAEEISERRRAKIEADIEGYRTYYRTYYAENRESVLEDKRKWREANADYQRDLVRAWEKKNPEKVQLRGQRRRARKSSLPDTFTHEQMLETLSFFDGGCALTGDVINVHWDHAIPIATDSGGTTEANMIPLRGDLNKRKSASNLFEWFERDKERLNLSEKKFDKLISFLAKKNGMSVRDYRSFYYEQFQVKEQL